MKIMDRIFFAAAAAALAASLLVGCGCQQHRLFRCVQRSRFLCGRIRRGGF